MVFLLLYLKHLKQTYKNIKVFLYDSFIIPNRIKNIKVFLWLIYHSK
jgi:hypothetical protein